MNRDTRVEVRSIPVDVPIIDENSGLIAAAHELKAPLALIRQLTLQIEHSSSAGDASSRLAVQARLSAERALRLATDLTKAARLEDALFQLEPVNPVAICEGVTRELSEYFAAHGKTLSVAQARSLPLVIAHHDLLRRVVTAFSDNALQYGGESVQLQVKKHADGHVRIAVRDYGPALSLADFRSIKRKLTSPQSVHARPQSSGLGLYIAGQFAQTMRGTIGMIRHRDGVSFYVDMKASTQLSLL